MLMGRDGAKFTYGEETDNSLCTNNGLEPFVVENMFYQDKGTIILTGKGFVGN